MREWDIKGREDAIKYAKKYNVPVTATKKSISSGDRNLWQVDGCVYGEDDGDDDGRGDAEAV